MGLTILCQMFLTFNMNDGMLRIVSSVPKIIVMGMNNILMKGKERKGKRSSGLESQEDDGAEST